MATIETDEYLTCKEAARALGLSPTTIRIYCNNFELEKTPSLKGMHVGRDWIIHKTEIARYKKERNDPGRPSNE